MQIGGDMRFGEASSAAWAISRVYGVGAGRLALYLLIVMVAMLSLSSLSEALLPPALANAAALPIIMVVGLGGIVGILRLRQWQVGQALRKRGQSLLTPITFAADDRGFVIDSAEMNLRIAWTAVTDLVQTRAHWVFLAGGMGYCVPRRFFAKVEDERAFVRAALAQFSEGARGRSRKATAFVAWE